MPLTKADTSKTHRFEDGPDWIELRIELDKGTQDQIADATATRYVVGDSGEVLQIVSQQHRANPVLFHHMCVAWSLSDTPTMAEYDELDPESGRWVDKCIGEALSMRKKRAEGNDPSKSRPKTGRASSASAEQST
jgi:hypothetical protein